jgi:DNA polymerase III epsilon subunit-like protein
MHTECSHRFPRRNCINSALGLLHVPASRWKACYSTTSTAATAAAAGKRQLMQTAATPRWFGFDTETCGLKVLEHEVIALAIYDLESGDAYATLINPALHNPSYKFGAEIYHGELTALAS